MLLEINLLVPRYLILSSGIFQNLFSYIVSEASRIFQGRDIQAPFHCLQCYEPVGPQPKVIFKKMKTGAESEVDFYTGYYYSI